MANEKVSQMASLGAAAVAPDDLLLITDTSEKESKKITTEDFLTYIESTGSFNAYHAALADSASSVLGTDVVGNVDTSSYSLNSNTSSYSIKTILSDSASHADTASLTLTCLIHTTTADTASFLDYTGEDNGTSSYSLISGHSILSDTSSTLLYIPGVSKNTSSYSITSSYSNSSSISNFSISSSYSSNSFSSTTSSFSSFSTTSSFVIGGYNAIKAWAYISWSVGVTIPQIITSYNISSVKWLGEFGVGPRFWDQFSVTFQQPLLNSNYMLIGDGNKPFGNQPTQVIFHPVYNNRTVSSFTMSISSLAGGNFYTSASGSYGDDEYGYIAFQILGL